MIRKPLIESQLRVLRGDRGHSREKREAYRRALYAKGYDVPGMWWRIGVDIVSDAAMRVARFGRAVVRHAAAGCPQPPPEVIAERMAICQACPNWRDGECGLCGCNLKAKTAWSLEQCPANPPRWERYSPLVQTAEHLEQLPLVPDTISNVSAGDPVPDMLPARITHDRGEDENANNREFEDRNVSH